MSLQEILKYNRKREALRMIKGKYHITKSHPLKGDRLSVTYQKCGNIENPLKTINISKIGTPYECLLNHFYEVDYWRE